MRDTLGMAHRIGDRYRASLRDTEQREAFEAGSVHDGFEVADKGLQRNIFDIAIRETVAACVVADQRVVARQLAIEVPPDRTLQIELEMRHPVSGLHERRSAADARIGELHAVGGHAEMNLLLVAGRRPAAAANRLTLLELQRLSFRQRLNVRPGEPKDADCTGDVLDDLFAQVGKGERELVSDLIVRRARYAQAPRLAESFQAGGNVDAIAIKVAVVDDDVADVDADSKDDALVLADVCVATEHAALNRNRALDRIDDAAEFDQRAVTGRLDDAAMMAGDRGLDQLAPMGFERR